MGRDITQAALAVGDNVVAGARRTEELAPLEAQYGEQVKPVTLEVRDEASAKRAVQLAVDTFGLDVLVNNAGYGQFAPFEQMIAEDQAVVDTCFYGEVYTTRAVIPVMRNQKSGHIFQVSSVGGRLAIAGNTPYHAAKWAVGGFSEALAMEGDGSLEGAVAIAQHDDHAETGPNRQIEFAVTVEVGHRQVLGLGHGIAYRGLEGAIAVAQQDRDGVVAVGSHYVEKTVVVEIPGGHEFDSAAGGRAEQTRACKHGQIASRREGQLRVKKDACDNDR